jgi:hypothetical protein
MNQYLKTTVSQIASLLVAGKYDELATLTHSVRLNAKDIATAVADYGRTLIAIPDGRMETSASCVLFPLVERPSFSSALLREFE